MDNLAVGYDHINKRLVAVSDQGRVSIPVQVTGTKHAAISTADVARTEVPLELFVKALKRYRNNNGKSFIVTVGP